MIDRRELLINLGLITGLSILPCNELLANDEKVIKNNVMPNYDAANAFYLGVNLGQAEAFAQKGQYYQFIGDTINRAQYHAEKVPQLAGMGPYLDSIRAQWRLHAGPNNTVANGHQLELNIDDLTNILVARLAPFVNVFYCGFRLGNSEAFAALGDPGALEWIRVHGLPEALGNANSAGIWTNQAALLQWAAACEHTSYWQKAIEGARRLLYEELIGPQQQLRVRSANVQIPIGPGQSIIDPLFARAIVIDDGKKRFAIVSVDATYVFIEDYNNVISQVKALTSMDTIILGATHTHRESTATRIDIQKAIADAILIVAGDLVPAEVGTATGEAYEGFNRVIRTQSQDTPPIRTSKENFNICIHPNDRPTHLTNHPLDIVNNEVNILHFRSASDHTTLATVVNYAAHAVVLVIEKPIVNVSADYPGEVEKFVMSQIGGECLFLQGAAGDIDPWCCLIPKPNDARGRMLQMADTIGGTVVTQIRAISAYYTQLPISYDQFNVPLPNFTTVNEFFRNTAFVTTILLGKDIALAVVPGEFFTSLGLYLKRISPCSKTFFIGYANDTIVYVPSIEDWKTGSYGTTSNPGDWCGIAKGDGERIVEAAAQSIGRLMTN